MDHAAGDLVCGEDYVLLAGGVGVSCDAVAVDGRDYASVTAVERLGMTVRAVEGEEENLKLTTPQDLVIAQGILERRRGAAK